MLEKAPITNTLSPDEYRDYDFFPGSFKRKEIFNSIPDTLKCISRKHKKIYTIQDIVDLL